MILTGKEILKRIENKEIIISPFSEENIGPNSYNLSLHNELLVYQDTILDPKKQLQTSLEKIPDEGLILNPGVLYLGRTKEYTETFNCVPMIEGRSSIGRLGMFVHITAGFGDIGFKGFWTLEISVIKPVKIYANMKLCQIYYHTICGDQSIQYNSNKYQNNQGIQPSLMYKDFENEAK